MYPMPVLSGRAAPTLSIPARLPPGRFVSPPLQSLVGLADGSFKVKLCKRWLAQAGCSRGTHCTFAHGECSFILSGYLSSKSSMRQTDES